MKIAILNDSHIGIRNSSDIFLDDSLCFFNNVFFPYCKKHNIKKIIHAGDFYDSRKFINFKAQKYSRKIIMDMISSMGMTMDIIPGNHDVYYRDTNSLCALKELLGYFTSNVSILMRPIEIDYGGDDDDDNNNEKIGLIPWINSENVNDTVQFLKKTSANIIIGHFELSGFELMKGHVVDKMSQHMILDAKILDRFDLVLSGHYHTKSHKKNIYYLGSQTEFTWADCDDPKYFHILDTKTKTIEAIRNPNKLFVKFYYDDSTKEKADALLGWCMDRDNIISTFHKKFVKIISVSKTNTKLFDDLILKIEETTETHDLKIMESFTETEEYINTDSNHIIGGDDTLSLLETHIEKSNIDVDKPFFVSKVRRLFIEAQNMNDEITTNTTTTTKKDKNNT